MNSNRIIEERQWVSKANNPDGSIAGEKYERYKWAKTGNPGEFAWINKRHLKIDLSYQREPVSNNRVLSIAREFSWQIFGAIIVAQTETSDLYVTDGAHRLRAAMLRGDVQELPCLIFPSKGQEYEADQFVGYNTTSKGVSAYDRHRAGLVANHEVPVMAEKIITSNGYSFAKNNATNFQTVAVGAVHNIVKRNADLADLTISLLTNIAEGFPLQSNEIKGLFYVIATNQSANIDWWGFPYKNLSEAGLGMMQSEMKRTVMFRGKGGERVLAEAIVEIINKGQVKNKVALPS